MCVLKSTFTEKLISVQISQSLIIACNAIPLTIGLERPNKLIAKVIVHSNEITTHCLSTFSWKMLRKDYR